MYRERDRECEEEENIERKREKEGVSGGIQRKEGKWKDGEKNKKQSMEEGKKRWKRQRKGVKWTIDGQKD